MAAWGHFDLCLLMEGARKGFSLGQLAINQNTGGGGVTARDCDLALWAKFGRSIPEALNILNSAERRRA